MIAIEFFRSRAMPLHVQTYSLLQLQTRILQASNHTYSLYGPIQRNSCLCTFSHIFQLKWNYSTYWYCVSWCSCSSSCRTCDTNHSFGSWKSPRFSLDKTRLRDLYWWQKMDRQITNLVKSCSTCQLSDKSAVTRVAPKQDLRSLGKNLG